MADAENESEQNQAPVEKEYLGMWLQLLLECGREMHKHEHEFFNGAVVRHACI